MVTQCCPVSQEPALHHLNHEENLIIPNAVGTIPIVAALQMLPLGKTDNEGVFRIDQEQRQLVRFASAYGVYERVVGCLSPPTWHRTRAQRDSRSLEKDTERLATPLTHQIISCSSTFHIELDPHHRFPPNSPMLHSSPSEYFSNHTFNALGSSRSNRDTPSTFSQTITCDGSAESASTSIRE